MMKLKVGHVFQAAPAVVTIINQDRSMPQKGKYRIARMFAKLKPEYDLILARRNAMIEVYGHKEMVPPPKSVEDPLSQGPLVPGENFSVPDDKLPEFSKAWAEIESEEIEVDVEPMPLNQLDPGPGVVGGLTAAEFVVLDNLVEG